MAARSGLSESTIGRIWRRFNLKPHLADGFKISTDSQFVAKVVDVVGLYHYPPEKAVVLCADEKSQMQALDRPARHHQLGPALQFGGTYVGRVHSGTSLGAQLGPGRLADAGGSRVCSAAGMSWMNCRRTD